MEKQNVIPRMGVESAVIRLLSKEDLPALEWEGMYRHFRAVYTQTYERYCLGLAVPWVADLPGIGIIGQVFIQLDCDRPELADGVNKAYLFSFRIKPQFQDQGLGSRMLQIVHNDLVLRQFKLITLNVATDNTRAIALYQKHGYTITANEAGTWSYQDETGEMHEVYEPAFRMEKKLLGPAC